MTTYEAESGTALGGRTAHDCTPMVRLPNCVEAPTLTVSTDEVASILFSARKTAVPCGTQPGCGGAWGGSAATGSASGGGEPGSVSCGVAGPVLSWAKAPAANAPSSTPIAASATRLTAVASGSPAHPP